MIDDIVGKKLPTGRNFKGNLKGKLYDATRSGALQNLANNQKSVYEIIEKRRAAISTGRYTKDKREADYKKALGDKNFSPDDKKDLKAILEHWGRGEVKPEKAIKKPAASVQKAAPSVRATRAADKRAELHATPDTELPDFLQKNRGSISISGNSSSHQSQRPGSGGGIRAGLGGATSASANNAGSTFKAPPRLLK